MKKNYCVAMLVFAGFCCLGCQQKNIPKDMPKLYPATILIKQGDTPLANAVVMLAQQSEGEKKWPCVGKTNANGIATMVTNGQYPGVAAGKYKVVVIKQEVEKGADPYAGAPDPKVDQDKYQEWYMKNEQKIAAMERIPHKTVSLVKAAYGSEETTTLEIEIDGKTSQYPIDVGPAVHDIVKDDKK